MKQSAGILLYRRWAGRPEVLLAHPGGPFWAKKDAHAWSMPKGEFVPGEPPLDAARREFAEEIGFVPPGEAVELPPCKMSGKLVHAFAVEGDCDPASICSNTFTLEWPPRSGHMRAFPEVDRAAWFDLATAREKINKGQVPLIDALEAHLRHTPHIS